MEDGWVDVRMGGWMDGIEADGWIDRCMDGFTPFFSQHRRV